MKEKTKNVLKAIFTLVTEIIRHFTVCKKQNPQQSSHPETTNSHSEEKEPL